MRYQKSDNNEMIYKENTKNHIDDIFGKRRGKNRKPGNILFFITMVVFVIILLLSILTLIFISNIESKIIALILFIIIFLFLIYDIKFTFTLDNLEIYTYGIVMPKRTFKEYKDNIHHFIAFKNILKIYIDKNFFIDNRIPLKPIQIIMKNKTTETINPYYFGNINKIEKIIEGKVIIVKY